LFNLNNYEYEAILEHFGNKAKGLTKAGRLCYGRLRECRKQTAEKEGIPPPLFCDCEK